MNTGKNEPRRKRPSYALALGLAAILATVPGPGPVADLQAPVTNVTTLLATPDGRIVTQSLPGIPAWPVPPALVVESYDLPESSAEPMGEPTATQENPSTRFWGYEAKSANARLLEYTIGPSGTGPVAPFAECMPDFTRNGRGVAFDPLDGNLWYTRLGSSGSSLFDGDGFIHKVTPPSSGCDFVISIPFGDGPGGTIQDDIGALDVDPSSKHLWAAGYQPVTVGFSQLSYLYQVNRNNGSIMRSCAIPFRGGGVGNDTLSVAKLDGLPGSGQYLLTDAGQNETNTNDLLVIDVRDCQGGVLVTPVAFYPKPANPAKPEDPPNMSGIDFEWMGLSVTSVTSEDPNISPAPPANLRNCGGQPFAACVDAGAWGNTNSIMDVSACGFRAGAGGNDACPFP